MRCAIWIGGREFAIEERPLPQPAPGEVRVRIHACGVCLTEVHAIDGLLGQAQPPRLMGHEWSGTVDAVGAGVTGLTVGTPVAGGGNGGFAEYLVRPADQVYSIPPSVPLEHAALLEPLRCCATAVEQAVLPLGAAVLITGAGPMGLLTLQLARRGGAARVLVSEPNPARRALALQLGAADAIDPHQGSLHEAVKDFTGDRGVDAAFECAGLPEPLADCLQAVARQGAVVMVGVHPKAARLDLPLYDFHFRSLRLIGAYGGAGRGGFRAAVEWLRQLNLAPLISHRFDLAEIAQAFEVARAGRGLKVLVGTALGRGAGA